MDYSIVEVMSFIVALCALFFTYYQTKATRKHNHLGVKPYLRFGWTASDRDEGIWLKNVGLGPAIIKNLRIYQKDKEIKSKELQDQMFDLGLETGVLIIDPGAVFPVNEERWLLQSKHDTLTKEQQEKFWGLLDGIKFDLSYKSFYGNIEPSISYTVENPTKNLVRGKPN